MKEDKITEQTPPNKIDFNKNYSAIMMSLGLTFGTLIGVFLHDIPVYLCIGMSIGLAIGAALDENNKKEKK